MLNFLPMVLKMCCFFLIIGLCIYVKYIRGACDIIVIIIGETMETANRVQNLVKSVYISHSANTLGNV